MATKRKAPAKRAPARKAAGKRPAFKAGGPRGSKAASPRGGNAGGPRGGKTGGPRGGKAARGPERKLPRKHGPRRKMPRSIGREAAPPLVAPGPAAPDESRPLAMELARAALEKKAEEVTVYDVRGLSSYADYLVIMTADSDRQATAVADNIDAVLKAAGHNKVAVEGYQTGTWVIVDYGDVVAHVMAKASREFYDLDGLWADAPRFTVEG